VERGEFLTVIQTPRLALSELAFHDAPFILRLLNEDSFLRFIGDKGVRTLADAREYIRKGPMDSYRRHGFGLYLTSLRSNGTPVGICGLVKRDTLPDADVGFAFLSQYWSNGYAVESAAAVVQHAGKALRLNRLVAITALENHGSMAVLTKIGMRLEGTIRLVPDGPELNLFGCAPRGAPP
jgi:RimJ/RimL family protein N-acetyltransferase